MRKKEPLIVIVVSNYNGCETLYKEEPVLKQCFVNLKKTKYKNYKIVMADGHSTDDSVNYVKKHFPYVDIVQTDKYTTFAEGTNNGIRHALKKYDPDYILLFNNDIIIKDGLWVNKILARMNTDERIGFVSCKLVYEDGDIQKSVIRFGDRFSLKNLGGGDAVDDTKYDSVNDAEVVSGAVLLIRRAVINKIGLMDENFSNGYDDVDYCLRTGEAGFRVIYDGTIPIIHLQSLTFKYFNHEKKRKHFIYYMMRNRYYFLRKYRHRFGMFKLIAWTAIYSAASIFLLKTTKGRHINYITFKDHLPSRIYYNIKGFFASLGMRWDNHNGWR